MDCRHVSQSATSQIRDILDAIPDRPTISRIESQLHHQLTTLVLAHIQQFDVSFEYTFNDPEPSHMDDCTWNLGRNLEWKMERLSRR